MKCYDAASVREGLVVSVGIDGACLGVRLTTAAMGLTDEELASRIGSRIRWPTCVGSWPSAEKHRAMRVGWGLSRRSSSGSVRTHARARSEAEQRTICRRGRVLAERVAARVERLRGAVQELERRFPSDGVRMASAGVRRRLQSTVAADWRDCNWRPVRPPASPAPLSNA